MSLNQKIRKFYDQSTPLWLDVWGEHMHHGFYKPGEENKSHQQAQMDLVEEMIRWGDLEKASQILDAGCGVGGSARLLAKKFNAKVLGVTLSPVQAENGQRLSKLAGLEGQVVVEAKDMMELAADGRKFDFIWSMESAEHIDDKNALLKMFYDLLTPGGRLLMATWCHRNELPLLEKSEENLLEKIYQLYHLPPMESISVLEQRLKEVGFEQIKTADWSDSVAPFWKAVIQSVFRWQSILGLVKAGWPTIRGAWAMRYMTSGYQKGIIKFGVFQATKL